MIPAEDHYSIQFTHTQFIPITKTCSKSYTAVAKYTFSFLSVLVSSEGGAFDLALSVWALSTKNMNKQNINL